MTAATFTRSIRGHYLRGNGVPISLEVALVWVRHDPLCVHLRVPVGLDEAVWSLSRELLADGLHTTAGIGDVALVPDTVEDVLQVWLSTDFVARFDLPLWEVTTFLDDIDQLMPVEEASDAVLARLDEELASLLSVPGGDT